MTRGIHLSDDFDEFGRYLTDVGEVVDVDSRLPDWPFLPPSGYVSVCEYDRLLGGSFGPVLQALSEQHGDESVTLVVVDPEPSYYRSAYSFIPGFQVDGDSLPDGYWAGLSHEPQGDPTGAIAYSANAIALVGSSHAWAMWGQRDWEIALVLTPTQIGPWLTAGVLFGGARKALDEFRGPAGWSKPLTESEIATFLRNVEQRGSGRGIETIRAWFQGKGFGLTTEIDTVGVVWAHLTSLSSGSIVVPKYGRGESEVGAAKSAKTRYESEQ